MANKHDRKMKARAISQAQKQRREEKQRISFPDCSQAVETPPVEVEETQPVLEVSRSTVAPLLLTIADVCTLLNVSRSTLLRLEKSGALPGRVKLGGQVRYHRQIIEAWLLRQVEGENA